MANTHNTDMLRRGMIHLPGRVEQGATRFHQAFQNDLWLKTLNLVLTVCIFRLWVTAGYWNPKRETKMKATVNTLACSLRKRVRMDYMGGGS